ncbi:hypothetical protein E4P43_17175 [Blastococcus sp. TF02A-35]|nr:hypothetical protein E4P43_17175 [Blastococcus sp. TF02A_35]
MVVAAITAGTTVLIPAGTASADMRCSFGPITINSNPGAEAPSTASGHTHSTGNHYSKGMSSSGVVTYYADNNGGSDGDTKDTLYGYLNTRTSC